MIWKLLNPGSMVKILPLPMKSGTLTYYFHPLTQEELGKDFLLLRSLKFGKLSMACAFSNSDKFLNSYIQTYLKEEV